MWNTDRNEKERGWVRVGNRKERVDPSQVIGVTKEPVRRTRNIDPRHENARSRHRFK